MRCPKWFPDKTERVVGKEEENTEGESSQYQGGEKGVQDEDVEQLLKRQRVPLIRHCLKTAEG